MVINCDSTHLSSYSSLSIVQLIIISFFITFSSQEKLISHPQLKYYELVSPLDVTHDRHIERRSASSQAQLEHEKRISFKAIGRHFGLLLNSNTKLFAPSFRAFTIDGNGIKRRIDVDLYGFYEGKVEGSDRSRVNIHIDSKGVLTGSIMTQDENYVLEPSWRHFGDSYNDSMIIYKSSDVDHSMMGKKESSHDYGTNNERNETKFCDYIKIEDDSDDDQNHANEVVVHERRKRNPKADFLISDDEVEPAFTPVGTHCALVLVADYTFYNQMGAADEKKTINYMIHIIDRVNTIFNETDWKDDDKQMGFKGMGFWIKEIMIHSEPDKRPGHYNSARKWSVRDLLEAFSKSETNSNFCLAHLFTHRTFENNVLGLAYVASPRINSYGGMCSQSYAKNGEKLYLNTGLTTTLNYFNKRIITREAVLVTAHELGHNWGSEHDPDTPECSPSSKNGGSYLMYTYAVSGYDSNNKFFSPCSLRSIRAVLMAKSAKCFLKPEKSYCGNAKVEEDEECDEGLLAKTGDYKTGICCDSNCKFKPGSYCSDFNSQCCENCKIKVAGKICRTKDLNNCKLESECDGMTASCPASKPAENGIGCFDKGVCNNGECLSFCQNNGQRSCMCDSKENACYRCCRGSINGTCSPTAEREQLRDGTPCFFGYCEKGRCEKHVQDFVERFWDIVEEININTFYKLMKDNIVFAVILSSTIFWFPIVWYINKYDENEKKKRQELKNKMIGVSDGGRKVLSKRTFSVRGVRPISHVVKVKYIQSSSRNGFKRVSSPLQDEASPSGSTRQGPGYNHDSDDEGGFNETRSQPSRVRPDSLPISQNRTSRTTSSSQGHVYYPPGYRT